MKMASALIAGPLLAVSLVTTFSADADEPAPVATPAAPADMGINVPTPDWGNTDIPPMAQAASIPWRRVTVRRYSDRTVTKVWERRGKGCWRLVAKRVRYHHKRLALKSAQARRARLTKKVVP